MAHIEERLRKADQKQMAEMQRPLLDILVVGEAGLARR